MATPDVIIIGAGPAGISMAYTLKHDLGFNDFTVGNTILCYPSLAYV